MAEKGKGDRERLCHWPLSKIQVWPCLLRTLSLHHDGTPVILDRSHVLPSLTYLKYTFILLETKIMDTVTASIFVTFFTDIVEVTAIGWCLDDRAR